MITKKFSGKKLAGAIYEQLAPVISQLATRQIVPQLDIIQVGGDEASALYAQRKIKAAEKIGLRACLHQLPSGRCPAPLFALIDQLNNTPECHGILVEQPLPQGYPAWLDIDPLKDVDGATVASMGARQAGLPAFVPATAQAAFEAIIASGLDIGGQDVTIIGRSQVVGRPLAELLCRHDATVTLCHSKTADLAKHTRTANIIVAATGRPGLITPDMVSKGVMLIDVGTTPTPDGLAGDIAPACYEKSAFYTPVPGGVGPVTVAILLRNLVQAAAAQNGVKI